MRILIINMRGNLLPGFLSASLNAGFRELGHSVRTLPENKIINDFSMFDLIVFCLGFCVYVDESTESQKESMFFAAKKFPEKCVFVEEDEYGPLYENDVPYISENKTIFQKEHIMHDFAKEKWGVFLGDLNVIPYFKREKSLLVDYPENVYPLPMCAFIPDLKRFIRPYPNREFDINARFTNSNPMRKRVLSMIETKFGHLNNQTSYNWSGGNWGKHELGQTEYWRNLANSKIGISPNGNGTQCIRDFETAAFTLSAIQKKTTEIPNWFADEKESLIFEDVQDLEDKVDFYLRNQKASERIYMAGLKKLVENHMPQHRAEYVSSIFRGQR